MSEKKMQLKPYPLGAHIEPDGSIRFSFVSGEASCGVIIYDKKTGKQIGKSPFLQEEKIGNIYCKYLQGVDAASISWQFYEAEQIVPDVYARAFAEQSAYGTECKEQQLKAIFPLAAFDWQGDIFPKLSQEQRICYCMHVRGFTMHPSSGVLNPGTFAGIIEKIPYLKESGITTIELQPAYEFMESEGKQTAENGVNKLNYWGYKKGFYYAPKSAYAAIANPSVELKKLVRELHKNEMELVMQFYFPNEVKTGEIQEILRFWVLEYHVDGFHLMGLNMPMDILAQDALLADTQLWYQAFENITYWTQKDCGTSRLTECRDDYLYTMRKFLKGDEGMVKAALEQMHYRPAMGERVHYISNYAGFTLMDMVSYNQKHNEANGEQNRDGNNHNCSWNCGEEGDTDNGKILALRRRQIRNAMTFLLLTESTPMVFMGDEFGNSQFGNNNPYCQDNETTWLNWADLERNQDLYRFWKFMLGLRMETKHLRLHETTAEDRYNLGGYPHVSYHGPEAWEPQLEKHSRHVGIMYYKLTAQTANCGGDYMYMAINMHWNPQQLALPKLPKGKEWSVVCCTDEDSSVYGQRDSVRWIDGRSIVIYKSKAVSSLNE